MQIKLYRIWWIVDLFFQKFLLKLFSCYSISTCIYIDDGMKWKKFFFLLLLNCFQIITNPPNATDITVNLKTKKIRKNETCPGSRCDWFVACCCRQISGLVCTNQEWVKAAGFRPGLRPGAGPGSPMTPGSPPGLWWWWKPEATA